MSATAERVVLLSIRPEFARMIFEGTKRVELRRKAPRVAAGDKVYVYVSSPVKALAGKFVVGGLVDAEIGQLWAAVRDCAGISREDFDEYYSGLDRGYAILVERSVRLPSPIGLDVLRRLWEGFSPPQSYAYLSPEDVGLLREGAEEA